MAKRILWLLNHTSLRKFEVPMLVEMGFEVFCPKIYELEYGDYSASISYEYDKTLTIPADVLEKLNGVDFYQNVEEDVIELLNEYFDIAICMFTYWPIAYLTRKFRGVVGLRAFGLEDPWNYTVNLVEWGHYGLLHDIKMMGDRFWFLPCYDNLAEIEAPVVRNHTIFLPIGMSNATVNNTWSGGDERILFISPKIKANSYYQKVYEDFCENFGDLPHVIGGAQPIPVPDDPTVTGFLSDEEYAYNMQHLAAMFYHSQEPRHLHYHPLEAVKRGMPLVFMAGGMLDRLGGKELPGRCKTIAEARRKLKRLAAGDKRLIKEITASQGVLLDAFKVENCRPCWQAGMRLLESYVPQREHRALRKKRIAVVLPAPYTGGVLDFGIRFALDVARKMREHHAAAELIFAYPRNDIYKTRDFFGPLREAGIPLREYVTSVKEAAWMMRAVTLAGYQCENLLLPSRVVCVLEDGAADFQDCDYLMFMADGFTAIAPVFCLQPYAVVAHDYIQRYVPEILPMDAVGVKLINQRQADRVFVTSAPSESDAVQYAGLDPQKVERIPLLLELLPEAPANNEPEKPMAMKRTRKTPYFLWSTNAAPHKNHLTALKALERYYQQGGRMNCVITGANTQYFSSEVELEGAPVNESYLDSIRTAIESSQVLKKHILIYGNLPKEKYADVLANAAFVFHPGFGDNGNGTIFDAAGMGVPGLSSDYPAMRYFAEFAGMPVRYTSPFDAEKMAQALRGMEQDHARCAAMLPARAELQAAEYRSQAEKLYEIVKKTVAFDEGTER